MPIETAMPGPHNRASATSAVSTGMPLPNFVVIGAMRSGTTSLIRYLDQHPDVFISRDKEPHFFDHHWGRGLEWYAAHFAGAGDQSAIGEGTQSYMYDERAPARLAATLPHARLVALLRNPVDRAYSQYWHKRARGHERLSFVDAIRAEAEGARQGSDRARVLYSYVDRGRYIQQLRRVCEHFPRESLLVILFERLREDPKQAYRLVCQHLNVDPGFRPDILGQTVNRYVEFRSLRARRLTKRSPEPIRRVVGRLNTRPASYPPMDPHVRAELRERFADANAELAAWLGHDLPEWDH